MTAWIHYCSGDSGTPEIGWLILKMTKLDITRSRVPSAVHLDPYSDVVNPPNNGKVPLCH